MREMKVLRMPRVSQFKKNLLSGFLSASAGFVLSMIRYPVFLKFAGYEIYGIWLVLTAVIQFAMLGLNSMTLGLVKLISEEHAKENLEDIEKYISTALSFLLAIGLFFFVCSLAFSGRIVKMIGISGPSLHLGAEYLPLIILLSTCIFLYEIINAVLSGLGRIDIANYSQTMLQGLPIIIAVPLFLIHVPVLAGLVIAHFAAYILISVNNIHNIRQVAKLKILDFRLVSRAHFLKLIKFSGAMFFSSVASLLFFPFSKIIISRRLGVSAVPIYEIAFRASYQMVNVFSAGMRALMPEISRLSAGSNGENDGYMKRINSKAYLLTIFGGASACAVMFLFAEIIFKLWLRKSFNSEIVASFRILVAGTLSSVVTMVPYYNLMGKGNIKNVVIYHFIPPIASVLAIFLFLKFGRITLGSVAEANSAGMILGAIFLLFSIRYKSRPAAGGRLGAVAERL